MPPKRRGRKPAAAKKTRLKKEQDPLAEEKRKKVDLILAEYDEDVANQCNAMKAEMIATCSRLQMLYDTALLTIPKEHRSLTKAQYKEKLESKGSKANKSADDNGSKSFDLSSIITTFESLRAATAKKKKLKAKIFTSASKVQKKFSKDSMDTSMTNLRTKRRALAKMQEAVTPVSRQVGLPVNYTPKTKMSSAVFNPPSVVTPKFDLRRPLASSFLRKPKAGEIVMSMSGSPLQIPSVDLPSKPGLMVSLGEGKVLNVSDPSSLSGIESNLDQSTLQTLRLVNEQLAKVLAS